MLLNSGGGTNLNWLNVLQGGFPGPIGATAVAVLLACLLYLFARHTASPLIALPYLLTCALIAASVSPRGRQRRDQRDAGDERRSAAVQRRVFGH